ncbi:O-antigen ligase family protein [Dokdonella sp.]|uniref:O-antigen ligase family protein n=1 Tax=Dokdonella sp. TaxID=2291710 RepID=UPI001B2B173E|nr:O-antigen ligase family protein [Dokdonella sp.]MBO9664325.1 O-antigen ligase family protein [Dokdonella sp.]
MAESTLKTRLAAWPVALVLAVIVLLPFGRSAEAPIVLGALAALVLLARGRLDWRRDASRWVLALFACYWIPALVSGLGAVEPGKTWSTVGVTLRFLPFALFTAWALRRPSSWRAVNATIAVVVLLWLLDAYVQMASGHSLGGAADKERLSGIFGAGNLKLGPTLAVLSPFVLLAARTRFGLRGLLLAFAVLTPPILLAGSRAAWLGYALVCLLIAWHETRSKRRFALALLVLALGVAALGTLALRDSERFGARVERSLLALRGTEAAVDEASAGRLSIWSTALKMTAAHPLSGVGVRGFRYAYPKYASANDRFVDTDGEVGASHAHQIVLEVLSETGLVGLAFWLAGAWFALRAWRRAAPAARERALAPGLALVAMCFPLNTHLAFYSAWWGLLFWWLLALYCAALGADEAPAISKGPVSSRAAD